MVNEDGNWQVVFQFKKIVTPSQLFVKRLLGGYPGSVMYHVFLDGEKMFHKNFKTDAN